MGDKISQNSFQYKTPPEDFLFCILHRHFPVWDAFTIGVVSLKEFSAAIADTARTSSRRLLTQKMQRTCGFQGYSRRVKKKLFSSCGLPTVYHCTNSPDILTSFHPVSVQLWGYSSIPQRLALHWPCLFPVAPPLSWRQVRAALRLPSN